MNLIQHKYFQYEKNSIDLFHNLEVWILNYQIIICSINYSNQFLRIETKPNREGHVFAPSCTSKKFHNLF